MIKRLGLWYLPDDENTSLVKNVVEQGQFSCYKPIMNSLDYLEKFDRAIDIGTWIGDSTDIMSRIFSTVYGFEANPEVFECATKNLKNRNNVILKNVALSNTEGVKELFNGPSSFSGWINTLEPEDINEEKFSKKMSVSCKTLDSYNFSNIDFIKIDIDSHEGYFLEGATNFFRENNPVILIEYKSKVMQRQHVTMKNPLEILQMIGYKIEMQPTEIDFILTRK